MQETDEGQIMHSQVCVCVYSATSYLYIVRQITS